jgi:hypothetical protein
MIWLIVIGLLGYPGYIGLYYRFYNWILYLKATSRYKKNNYHRDDTTLSLKRDIEDHRKWVDTGDQWTRDYFDSADAERKLRGLPEDLEDPAWAEAIDKEYQEALAIGKPETLDMHALLIEYCRATKSYGLAFTIHDNQDEKVDWKIRWEEITKAAPWLDHSGDDRRPLQALVENRGVILFKNAEDMDKIFSITKGDDPSALNPYNDRRASVYILTVGPNGAMNENT